MSKSVKARKERIKLKFISIKLKVNFRHDKMGKISAEICEICG